MHYFSEHLLDIRHSGLLSSLNFANNQLSGEYGDDMSGVIALTEALLKW